jgi:hypothetical protein
MPGFMLNNRQMHALFHLANIGKPISGSPLWLLPEPDRLMPDDPAFQYLIDQSLIEKMEDGYRVNKMFAAALLTCAKPEEVISVGIDRKDHLGFAVVRRGQLWCECTVNHDGVTKIYFPLSRSTLVIMLTDALTGNSPEGEDSGFRFKGDAAEAFVLAAAMRELREYPVELRLGDLKKAVGEDALNPAYAAPFTSVTGLELIEKLAEGGEAIDKTIESLVNKGHLIVSDGRVKPSEKTELVLGQAPEAGFAVSRTVITGGGPKTQQMLVVKAGGHKLVFRLAESGGKTPLYEWVEVNRTKLRLLVAALTLPEDAVNSLSAALAAEEPAADAVETAPERAFRPSFCTNCGAPLKEGATFCTQCGERLKRIAEV